MLKSRGIDKSISISVYVLYLYDLYITLILCYVTDYVYCRCIDQVLFNFYCQFSELTRFN